MTLSHKNEASQRNRLSRPVEDGREAPVAQWSRVADVNQPGRRFESCRGLFQKLPARFFVSVDLLRQLTFSIIQGHDAFISGAHRRFRIAAYHAGNPAKHDAVGLQLIVLLNRDGDLDVHRWFCLVFAREKQSS